MTKINFQLKEDSEPPAILTSKQIQMKKELEESLDWVEQHQKGEVKGHSAYDLLKELESICEKE